MSSNPRGTRWVFTINNYTDIEEDLVRSLETNTDVKVLIAEVEHLDEGTPHIQGYIRFYTRVYRTTIERLLGGRAFIEAAKGSEADNIHYCSKENQIIVEKGTEELKAKKSGKTPKTDEDAAAMIKDMREMAEDEFEAAHPKFFMNHVNLVRQFRHEYLVQNQVIWEGQLAEKNIWIWGPPGKGKSKCSRIGVKPYQIFSKSFNKWWNGFDADKIKRVIVEDWPSANNGGNILCQHLKIWGDRYPFTAETKGGHLAIEPSFQLIVTSNYSIDQCFSNEEDQDAIKRRFTELFWDGSKEDADPFTFVSIDI